MGLYLLFVTSENMGVRGKIIFTTVLFLSILAAKAQTTERDSLINVVNSTPGDTFKVLNFARLSRQIALLLSFEFINLLIHPFLESVTNHSPALMLLSLVIIAAILVPLHHKLVSWVTHQVVEKNRCIRLSAAKKTIASLESETTDKSLNK